MDVDVAPYVASMARSRVAFLTVDGVQIEALMASMLGSRYCRLKYGIRDTLAAPLRNTAPQPISTALDGPSGGRAPAPAS